MTQFCWGEAKNEATELAMLRIHARAADEYIRELVDFLRSLDELESPNLYLRNYAKRLICMERGCYNRPGDWTPDGRGFCGQHAHVMD